MTEALILAALVGTNTLGIVQHRFVSPTNEVIVDAHNVITTVVDKAYVEGLGIGALVTEERVGIIATNTVDCKVAAWAMAGNAKPPTHAEVSSSVATSLATAKAYTDAEVATSLSSAKAYADTKANAAKSYAAGLVSEERTYADSTFLKTVNGEEQWSWQDGGGLKYTGHYGIESGGYIKGSSWAQFFVGEQSLDAYITSRLSGYLLASSADDTYLRMSSTNGTSSIRWGKSEHRDIEYLMLNKTGSALVYSDGSLEIMGITAHSDIWTDEFSNFCSWVDGQSVTLPTFIDSRADDRIGAYVGSSGWTNAVAGVVTNGVLNGITMSDAMGGIASNEYAFAVGFDYDSEGKPRHAVASKPGAMAFGSLAKATGLNSMVIGSGEATTNYAVAISGGKSYHYQSLAHGLSIAEGHRSASFNSSHSDGQNAFSIGAARASGQLSFAGGGSWGSSSTYTETNATHSLAFGVSAQARAKGQISLGYAPYGMANDDYAFTWFGDSDISPSTTVPHRSKGKGTFSIYPRGGERGFFIRGTNFHDLVDGHVDGWVQNSFTNMVTSVFNANADYRATDIDDDTELRLFSGEWVTASYDGVGTAEVKLDLTNTATNRTFDALLTLVCSETGTVSVSTISGGTSQYCSLRVKKGEKPLDVGIGENVLMFSRYRHDPRGVGTNFVLVVKQEIE